MGEAPPCTQILSIQAGLPSTHPAGHAKRAVLPGTHPAGHKSIGAAPATKHRTTSKHLRNSLE